MKLLTALILGSASVQSLAINLTDGTFSDSDWKTTFFTTSQFGSVTGHQVSDGNPGQAYDVDIERDNRLSIEIIGFSISQALEYDPQLSGAIQEMDLTIDYRSLTVFGDGPDRGMAYGLAAEQDGNFYIGGIGHANNLDWTTSGPSAFTGLIGGFWNSGSLDVSSTADPIFFGFYTYAADTDNPDSTTTPFNSEYDNYSVGVTPSPTPEPFTLAGVGAGALCLICRSRGRRRSH